MGTYRWLKWKISPHKAADGTVQGIILVFEDVSQEAKEREIHKRALSVARIGGWEIDLLTNQIYWTDITKEIHEVPQDFVPNLEEGINFYKEGRHRDTITQLVAKP